MSGLPLWEWSLELGYILCCGAINVDGTGTKSKYQWATKRLSLRVPEKGQECKQGAL